MDTNTMSQQEYAGITKTTASDADYGAVLQQRQRLEKLTMVFREELDGLSERLSTVLVERGGDPSESGCSPTPMRCGLAEMFANDLDRFESYLGRLGDLRRSIDI